MFRCQNFYNYDCKSTFVAQHKRNIKYCNSILHINNRHTNENTHRRRRVVVTGLGVVSPVGCSTKSAWDNILKGYCGIKILDRPKYESVPCKIAANINEEELELSIFSNSEIRSISTATMYALMSGLHYI